MRSAADTQTQQRINAPATPSEPHKWHGHLPRQARLVVTGETSWLVAWIATSRAVIAPSCFRCSRGQSCSAGITGFATAGSGMAAVCQPASCSATQAQACSTLLSTASTPP